MAGIPDVNELLRTKLSEQSIKVSDFTGKIHTLNYKFPLYLRPSKPVGIVMHNTSGLVTLANLVGTWKNKEPSPPPSHLAIDRSGEVGFYVRLPYADRATENTNRHLSIEFQAVENGDITREQVKSAAVITSFAHVVYDVALAISDSRTASGLAHHSLFVERGNPNGHFNCPGQAIINQKPAILELAKKFKANMQFSEEPAGRWEVRVDKWVWHYTFSVDGSVVWLDPFNKKTGKGRWTIKAGTIVFAWTNSTSKEKWNLPLSSTDQTGQCIMDGKTYDLRAKRL